MKIQGAEGLPVSPPQRGGFNLKAAILITAAAGVLLAAGIFIYCHHKSQNLTVALVSGLGRPYSVVLNGRTYDLAPYSTQTLQLPEGRFLLEDAPGGNIVGDKTALNFSIRFLEHLRSNQMAVINPDRVAVLVYEDIPYYNQNAAPPRPEPPVFRLLANLQSYFIPTPDFILVAEDRNIALPKHLARLVKTRLGNIPHPDLALTLRLLQEKSGYSVARDHLMLQARHRTDEALLTQAVLTLQREDFRPFFLLHLADRPVLVDWHRYYQQQMDRFQPEYDLVAEYAAYLRAEPDNAALMYLLGRQTIDPATRTQLLQGALAAKPPCPYAYSAIGYDALSDGQYAEAIVQFDASHQAGVTSPSILINRRQAYFATGRIAEILPEFSSGRKNNPHDLDLATEEIRATYASTHDKAALERIRDDYLAILRKPKFAAKNPDEASAILDAEIAYQTGDLPAYARLLARFPSPYFQFRTALTSGNLAEAARVITPADTNSQLLLYLLAFQQGRSEQAEQHFLTALDAMKKDEHVYRAIAGQLTRATPDARAVCALHLNVESKRILLTALGTRYGADRSTYFDLARKLNYHPAFPNRFLSSFLDK